MIATSCEPNPRPKQLRHCATPMRETKGRAPMLLLAQRSCNGSGGGDDDGGDNQLGIAAIVLGKQVRRSIAIAIARSCSPNGLSF